MKEIKDKGISLGAVGRPFLEAVTLMPDPRLRAAAQSVNLRIASQPPYEPREEVIRKLLSHLNLPSATAGR